MDCSEFRRHHLAYVDDTLPGDVLVAAERHRVECAACGAHDTLVRRSLLLARNLPTIEPSADFAARLEARLCQVRAEGRAAPSGELTIGRANGDTYGGAYSGAYGGYAADGGAAWYARLAREAGGWGRQAAAAAVVCAAVSAGYALRAREGVAPAAPTATPATGAATPVRAAAVSGGLPAAPTFGATSLGAAPLESLGTSAAAGTAAHAPRVARRGATRAAPAAAAGGDELGVPAYIPLPAGALEAASLLGPTSAGVPVWAAALLAGEAPSQLRSAAPGGPTVRLVGLSH